MCVRCGYIKTVPSGHFVKPHLVEGAVDAAEDTITPDATWAACRTKVELILAIKQHMKAP